MGAGEAPKGALQVSDKESSNGGDIHGGELNFQKETCGVEQVPLLGSGLWEPLRDAKSQEIPSPLPEFTCKAKPRNFFSLGQ